MVCTYLQCSFCYLNVFTLKHLLQNIETVHDKGQVGDTRVFHCFIYNYYYALLQISFDVNAQRGLRDCNHPKKSSYRFGNVLTI